MQITATDIGNDYLGGEIPNYASIAFENTMALGHHCIAGYGDFEDIAQVAMAWGLKDDLCI